MPSTIGFHHLTMVSGDAPRTVRFYRDTLGLGLIKKTVNFDDPTAYHLYFGDEVGRPGTLLTFFEWRGIARGRPGIGGIHHLALEVPDEAAILKWKRRLNDLGIRSTGPRDRGYFTSLYFNDPDGLILELATTGPGYTVDEPAGALDQAVVPPPTKRLPGTPEGDEYARQTHPEPVPAITPDMAIRGIHHVSGISDDLDRAHEFYVATLGLARVKRTVNQDDLDTPHHFWAHLAEDRVTRGSGLSLFGWRAGSRLATGGTGVTHHIAFRARNDAEQAEWRDRLLGMGVQVSPVMDRCYFNSIYFRSPDGLTLEIATDGPGFLVDEPRGTLGTGLMLPAWLEGERAQIERALEPL
jgi:glyoxalase family protein